MNHWCILHIHSSICLIKTGAKCVGQTQMMEGTGYRWHCNLVGTIGSTLHTDGNQAEKHSCHVLYVPRNGIPKHCCYKMILRVVIYPELRGSLKYIVRNMLYVTQCYITRLSHNNIIIARWELTFSWECFDFFSVCYWVFSTLCGFVGVLEYYNVTHLKLSLAISIESDLNVTTVYIAYAKFTQLKNLTKLKLNLILIFPYQSCIQLTLASRQLHTEC